MNKQHTVQQRAPVVNAGLKLLENRASNELTEGSVSVVLMLTRLITYIFSITCFKTAITPAFCRNVNVQINGVQALCI